MYFFNSEYRRNLIDLFSNLELDLEYVSNKKPVSYQSIW